MSRTLRIAIARLSHETNCRSPLPTTAADFRRSHWLEGDGLAAALVPGAHEVENFLKRAELAGAMDAARADGAVTVVPLLSAWAVPGGPLTPDAWAELSGRLLQRLEDAGPLDGLLLVLHGALAVQGVHAPEVALLRDVRARLGDRARLGVAFDLHAHVTPEKLALPDVLVAYRTNPHRDFVDTGRRGMGLLLRLVRGQVKPTTAWRSLPMVLGGGTTLDFAPAMFPVFRALRAAVKRPGVLDASLFICHPWIGDPSPCWAVHVTTDAEPALAESLAEALAERVWAIRHIPPLTPISAPEAVHRVRRAWFRRHVGTAALVDTSDIVGAGAPGDHTGLLRELMDTGADLRTWVPLRDPEAVATLAEHAVGATVSLEVGGTWSDRATHRIAVRGRLVHRGEAPGVGRTATLDLGGPAIVLTEGPPLSLRPSFFHDAGLSVFRSDAIVMKSLMLWLPYFAVHASQRMLVRTRGATDFDAILDGPFAHPVHPRDEISDWRPHDATLRGVS